MKGSGQRVLVIDDDEVALELLSARIHAAGFDVVSRKAPPPTQEVKRLGLAAVVCDLVMESGMDGDRVLSRLHAEPELREVPFILVSADAARLEHALGRMPWLHCVPKDKTLTHLMNTLDKLIERRTAYANRARPSLESTSVPPRALGSLPRDHARPGFYEHMRESLRQIRPYLIGGVLGPRAHAEVQKRIRKLREEAAITMLSPSMGECLTLCEQLTERAQRDLRAMELLSACTSWLSARDESEAFPLTLDSVPVLRAAKTYLA